MKNSITLHNFSNESNGNYVLDNLPFGITVQTKERVIVYENKFAVDLLGHGIGSLCYRRWSYLNDYADKPCMECPGHISLEDGEDHEILRNITTKEGKQFLVEVLHHPILNKDGSFDRFIEIIKPIKSELAIDQFIQDNSPESFQISIMKFGTMGGEQIVSDQIDFISKNDELVIFTTRVAAFWFAAIGQGHQWPRGLFGPLPVLDYHGFHSYGFSAKLKLREKIDIRLKDTDLVVVIIFTKRQNELISQRRSEVNNLLENLISSYETIEDVDFKLIEKIKTSLSEL